MDGNLFIVLICVALISPAGMLGRYFAQYGLIFGTLEAVLWICCVLFLVLGFLNVEVVGEVPVRPYIFAAFLAGTFLASTLMRVNIAKKDSADEKSM